MNDSTQWTLPPARQEDYEGRDRHWNLRKMMLAAAKDCDLFGTLFYFYYYCMAQCCDKAGYTLFSPLINLAEQGTADTDPKDTNTGSFDSLKKAAADYYNISPETQRRNVRNLLQKIGWKLDDAFEKHYGLANEVIEWYEKGIEYVYEILDLSFRYSIDYDFDPEAAHLNIFYFKPHKVHHLAYWYSVFSMKQDCFEESLLMPKTGKELYDFLSDIENRPDIFDEKKRKSVLDTVRMALKAMRPFVESQNWLDMTSNEQ